MKKLLLTLLTTCIMFTCVVTNLSAEEIVITKDYLKNTLNMSDDEIVGAGLSYVYDVGDELLLTMKANQDIDAERNNDNFTISKDTEWQMHFKVADQGKDNEVFMTLVSTDALPIGKVSLDDGSHPTATNYEDFWIHNFLNQKIYTMFTTGVQEKITGCFRPYYKLTNDSGVLRNINSSDIAKMPSIKNSSIRIFIPGAKELGFGTSYTINEGTVNNLAMPLIGNTIYSNYSETANSVTANLDGEQTNYWLREDFYADSNPYFLCTNATGLTHANKDTAKNGVIIAFNVRWSKDTKNDVTIENKEDAQANSVLLQAYTPATYEVSLPETVTLTKGYTQFKYSVKGDLEKNNIVKVEFPKTASLKFTGGFSKSDIDLNIFNEKVNYNRSECSRETTSTVTIKNEIPSAGTWEGNLPVTISFE